MNMKGEGMRWWIIDWIHSGLYQGKLRTVRAGDILLKNVMMEAISSERLENGRSTGWRCQSSLLRWRREHHSDGREEYKLGHPRDGPAMDLVS